MRESFLKEYFVIFLTIGVAVLLTIVPVPTWAVYARPRWVFLVLMFWMISAPHRVGIGTAWIVGLIVDFFTGTLLGLHAFMFTLLGYIVIKLYQRLRYTPVYQQAIIVFFIILIDLVLNDWIMIFLAQAPIHWSYWLPALTSALIWPFIYFILKDIQPHSLKINLE